LNIAIIVLLALLAAVNLFLLFRKKEDNGIKDFSDFMIKNQSEMQGRLSQLSEIQQDSQAKLNKNIQEQQSLLINMVNERLNNVSKDLGTGLQKNSEKTFETLQSLGERLAKIDVAQKKISDLSEQVVSLQEVLSNKQARGAFGEIQLNDLVTSILPPSSYDFQVKLSNDKRADCVLKLPNPPGDIVIDAKFPLESYQALRNAETDREILEAKRFFRDSVQKHVKDISEKYIIAGETAESALMFLPSEAIYAELHANFVEVVENSYKAKVWIVSPTTLMATLNTVRAVLKDSRMREQAGVIQKYVGLLTEDITRLDKRVEKLSTHFDQAGRDIEDIKKSSGRITGRADKIEAIQLGEEVDVAIGIENK